MHKTTLELVPGDLLLIDGRLIRTVAHVRPNGYENARGQTLYNVMYAEGPEAGVWSGGNSGAPGTLWELVEQCSANVGGDPAAGCDEYAVTDGLCEHHAATLQD